MKSMKIMNNEIRRDEQGFYEMPLPFKTENPIIGILLKNVLIN